MIIAGMVYNISELIVRARKKGISFRYADLDDLDLQGVDFRGMDLRDANFHRSNLRGAWFHGAKVDGVHWPAPTMVLLANWGECSDRLTTALMRYDAANHPDPKAFLNFGTNGWCPYRMGFGVTVERCANFNENQMLIGKTFLRHKVYSAYELMQMLLREHCNVDDE